MANQPWFRMYAEFATDPKIQFLSEALQRRYVFALCVTCNGEIDKLTDDELAFAMRITPEEWAETKRLFIERGLFNNDGKVANWEKRQYKTDVADPTNAERQRRYRNGKRNGGVTEEKRPDTDTDTEEKIEIPYTDVLSCFNKFCPSLPKVNPLNISEPRHQLIKAAVMKYRKNDGGYWPILDTLFKKVEASDFLTERKPGSGGRFFRAKFDWIFDPDKMAKILEGDYDNSPEPPPKKREVVL